MNKIIPKREELPPVKSIPRPQPTPHPSKS